MPAIVTDDGVKLHAEETGQGEPLLFVHEFAGDHRSWEPQVRFFSAAYRRGPRLVAPAGSEVPFGLHHRHELTRRPAARGNQPISDHNS